MKNVDIRSKCRINSNYEMDAFVGLKCDDGDISINFPIGYHISEDNKGLRDDILLLFTILAANTERRESELLGQGTRFDEVDFPLQSYIYIIRDFFQRGYYRERKASYKVAKTGKVSWNKTIKTQKPYMQDKEILYLDFVVRKNCIKEDALITLIHEYCVYESFDRIGWLFTKMMPRKPGITKQEKYFRLVLKEKIASTFNDRNRLLFKHMLAIIDFEGDNNSDKNYRYGTSHFEYVWEKMIDKVFGIKNKSDYFPKTTWYVNHNSNDNDALKPDTIMVHGCNVYILDAKYYKFGVTGKLGDLPKSTSINKQITYGEYVAYEEKFREKHGKDMKVYNAFLMPFDASNNKDSKLLMVKMGEAAGNWKDNSETYQKIQGILIDVKALMEINGLQNSKAVEQLAKVLES